MNDLRRLRSGQIVMMHASVHALGPVHGGPDEIHLAVEEAVAPSGTLMMFVGCQPRFDDVGRGNLSAEEEAEVLAHQPPFDFQNSLGPDTLVCSPRSFAPIPAPSAAGAFAGEWRRAAFVPNG